LGIPTSAQVVYLGYGYGGAATSPEATYGSFRMYNKALNADQIRELYEYDAPRFGHRQNLVSLHKGNLGVGVSHPTSRFEIAGDERIQEYPPRDLGGFETMIEGEGTYKVSSSSDVPNPDLGDGTTSGTTSDHPAIAFTANNTFFRGVNNTYDNTSVPSPYTGSHFTNGVGGDFVQIELPHKIYLKSINITSRTSLSNYYDRAPHTGFIFGSNNGGTTWSQVASWTGLNWTLGESKPIQINSNTLYSTYRLVANKLSNNVGGAVRFNIDRWQLFGTPGPTTLDKGSLSLTRSLDVPRISRYDVDTETPRPEKLVVDFDTTVNSSPTDISRKENHGTLVNGAAYSSTDRAFVFDGTNDYLLLNDLPQADGNFIHSVSYWLQDLRPSGATSETFLYFGAAASANQDFQIQYNYNGNGTIYLGTQDNWLTLGNFGDLGGTGKKILRGEWNHYAYTYNGTSTQPANLKFYMNGEEMPMSGSGSSSALSFSTGSTPFYIGRHSSSVYPNNFEGKFSNFKMYNVALEPSEVQKLYRLGRTGRSMVISDTTVGIGKVPEAQLDVRGSLRCDVVSDFLKIDHPGNQLSISRSDAYKNEFRWYAWSGGCNWFTPYTGNGIYIGRDGETLTEFNFYNVTTVKRGSSVISSSDDRLKRDEAFITNATDTLLKLKPQTYIKKHRLPENENDIDIPEQFEAGLIAQDVWYDAPEIRFLVHPCKDANPSETKPISPDPNDPTQDPDYSSWGTTQAYVNYEGFLPYLIKSNQEIYTELQAEKVRNDTLEARVTALENA